MDVHSFINKLRDNKKNASLVEDIKSSIKETKRFADGNLILEVPPPPADVRKKLKAKCIHGHVFEDFVLQSALEDGKKVFTVQDDTDASLKKQMKERKQEFKEIYDENPKKKYETSMANAGNGAWKILSAASRSGNAGKRTTDVKFEEWVRNSVSSELMKSLRADFVARTGDKVLLVDLKFTTTKKATYEGEYLIDGIIQVLIYALLKGVEPSNITLGVLVYYGREGEVVLYTTDKRHDAGCMKTLMQKAGIKDIGAKHVDKTKISLSSSSKVTSSAKPFNGILKKTANILNQAAPRKRIPRMKSKTRAEFSDDEEEPSIDMRISSLFEELSTNPVLKGASLLLCVVVLLCLVGWLQR